MEPRDSSLFELPEQTLRGPRRGGHCDSAPGRDREGKSISAINGSNRYVAVYCPTLSHTLPKCGWKTCFLLGWFPQTPSSHLATSSQLLLSFEAPKEDSVLLLRQGPICYSATTWKNATKIWFKLQDSLPLQSCVPTFAWMISKIYKCTRGFCELIRTESCRWNVPWFPVLCAGSSYHLKVIHSEASLLKCHRPSEVLQCELWSSAGPHFSKRQADSAYGGWGSEHFKCR